MNPTEHDPSVVDPELLDLLVDGELDEPRRRELLEHLDRTPGEWRRCALAFLEAQSWRQGLDELRARSLSPGRIRPRNLGGRLLFGMGRGTLVAMAASFLAALSIGLLLREAFDPGTPPPAAPEQLAGSETPAPAPPVEPPQQPPAAETRPLAAPAEEPWQYVTIPVSTADGTADSVRLPVVERDGVDEDWLAELPAAVPDDVVEAFLRTGHEVQQRRRLLPLRMRDGRDLVVPYDQVEIRYVGGSAFQ